MLSVCSANSLMKYSDCSYRAISQRQFVQQQNPVTVNTFFIEFLPTQHIQLEKPTTEESHLQNVHMRLQLISNIICSLKMCLFSMVTKTKHMSCHFIYHLKHFLCLVCNQPYTSHDNKNVLSTRTAKIYKQQLAISQMKFQTPPQGQLVGDCDLTAWLQKDHSIPFTHFCTVKPKLM